MRYYNEYVNHMIRFYVRHCNEDNLEFKKEVDKKNWFVVKKTLDNLPDEDKNVIIKVYELKDTLSDNVYEVSKELKMNQEVVWTILNKVSKKIAKERELI